NLYVANAHPISVSVFDTAHGNAALPAITRGGMNDTVDVAVDATGKLYVANDRVSVFNTARGNAVLPAISGGGLSGPYGVAIDARGKLYVANTKNSSLSVFDTARGNAPLLVITRSLKHPAGVTIH
ncbi:MAG: hypothetical protein GIX03_14385, partial [Candidatus Eremiobacteraeota bacterium]|nr:hypothetical protein [Candidatus Eremiobacteraeota bacterium]